MSVPDRARQWTRHRLGDVVEFASGQVDPTSEQFRNLPHVGSDNIESKTGRLVGIRSAAELGLTSGKFLFDKSTVLYSKIRPYLNKVATPDFTGICSADIYPLRPRTSTAARSFIAHVLRQPAFLNYADSCSTRTSIPKINRIALAAYEFMLPPLAEQRRIAAILDKADALRRKRQEAIALTEQLLRSTFLEMFGDPVTNPKRWPMVSLGEIIAETQYGTAQKANSEREGLPILRMNNLTYSGGLDLTDIKWCEIAPEDQNAYTVRRGDLLFNRTNSAELVGKTAVWTRDDQYAYAGYLIRVRFHPSAHAHFVSAYLNSEHGKRTLAGMAKASSNMSNISASDIRRIRLPLPNVETQQSFSDFVERVTAARLTHTLAQAEADTLFNSLTHRAFTGQL